MHIPERHIYANITSGVDTTRLHNNSSVDLAIASQEGRLPTLIAEPLTSV